MEEVLNIISNSLGQEKIGGPNKVILNTLKGLDKIGYPYVVNGNIGDYKFNWIHDSVKGIIEAFLKKIPVVIGPNIVVLPDDLWPLKPFLCGNIYLHPSAWCVDVWKKVGFNECPLFSWPAGIDIQDFILEKSIDNQNNVLIYFKRRDPKLLEQAIVQVKSSGYNPLVIKYGEYDENEYKTLLSKSLFGIWIGTSESQGIALQEALASNLPLIVCDVNSLFEAKGKNDYLFPEKLRDFKPTSVPYFDERCGIIINDISKLGDSIRKISGKITSYNPREYIMENLSLEKQAIELLSFFDILKGKHPYYFSAEFSGYKRRDFSLSLSRKLIYSFFILKRKSRTAIRLLKKNYNNKRTRLVSRFYK